MIMKQLKSQFSLVLEFIDDQIQEKINDVDIENLLSSKLQYINIGHWQNL